MGFTRIMQDLEQLAAKSVVIGIQEGSKTHLQVKKDRTQKAGINIAGYAAQNEFGTDKIPERSFMRSAFDENITKIEEVVSDQYGKVIDGAKSLDNALRYIGLYVQGLVQTKIRQITFPPNSRRTIEEKKSSKPLIDFGQMIAAVRYALKTRKV